MSIPLDRLYNYIESLVKELHQDSILIYRFYPHGSKKLEDLSLLVDQHWSQSTTAESWVGRMYTPTVIAHDQEPLNFNFYTKQQFEDLAKWNDFGITDQEYVDILSSMHLRLVSTSKVSVWDKTLLVHSEKNSTELNNYENADFIGVYWWSHASIARDWFRYAEYDRYLTPNFEDIDYDFLIYNRAWSGTREYRLKFAELLVDYNLASVCNTKFSALDENIHYRDHQYKNPRLAVSRSDLENYYPANSYTPTASADYNENDYAKSGIEVVLETIFDDSRWHLTEKSLRPIACGRPFMLVGTPGVLEYLKSYGFRTFSGLIDESYDSVIDPVERLECIVNEMRRIANLPADAKRELWAKLYEIAAYNKKLFFSERWHTQILNELKTNLNLGLEELKKHHTGKFFRKLREFYSKDPVYTEMFLTTDRPERTLEELNQILQFMDQK